MKFPLILSGLVVTTAVLVLAATADSASRGVERNTSLEGDQEPIRTPTVNSTDTIDNAATAFGVPPNQLAFQGFLQDAAGNPVDGSVNLDFRLWTSSAGGTLLWSESQGGIPADEGVFHVGLGAATSLPLSIFDGSPIFLGIQVNGEPELPRTRLLATAFALRAAEADHALTADVAIGDDGDWTMSGDNVHRNLGNVGIGTTTPEERLHVQGTMQTGSSTTNGALEVYKAGSVSPSGIWGDYLGSGQGGGWAVTNESGLTLAGLGPDLSAGAKGASFAMLRNDTESGFVVDGNFQGSENTSVSILGSSRSVVLNMNSAGDASVALPTDAISSVEILDEPGVGHAHTTTGANAGPTVGIINTRTITVPSSGYVLAIATAQVTTTHANGSLTDADIGLNVDNSSAFAANVGIQIPSGASSGTYEIPAAVTAILPVSAGAHTVYFLAQEHANDITLFNRNLSVVFIPTAYGTVQLRNGGPIVDADAATTNPLSSADVSVEQAESVRFNDDRIQRELAAMQARLAELEAQLAAEQPALGTH